jgi:hypothetical protein
MAEVQGNGEQNIAALLTEHRVFEPPEAFTANAVVKNDEVYQRAEADFQGFWAEQGPAAGRVVRSALTEAEVAFIRWARVGRLATVDADGAPHVVPVCPAPSAGPGDGSAGRRRP